MIWLSWCPQKPFKKHAEISRSWPTSLAGFSFVPHRIGSGILACVDGTLKHFLALLEEVWSTLSSSNVATGSMPDHQEVRVGGDAVWGVGFPQVEPTVSKSWQRQLVWTAWSNTYCASLFTLSPPCCWSSRSCQKMPAGTMTHSDQTLLSKIQGPVCGLWGYNDKIWLWARREGLLLPCLKTTMWSLIDTNSQDLIQNNNKHHNLVRWLSNSLMHENRVLKGDTVSKKSIELFLNPCIKWTLFTDKLCLASFIWIKNERETFKRLCLPGLLFAIF